MELFYFNVLNTIQFKTNLPEIIYSTILIDSCWLIIIKCKWISNIFYKNNNFNYNFILWKQKNYESPFTKQTLIVRYLSCNDVFTVTDSDLIYIIIQMEYEKTKYCMKIIHFQGIYGTIFSFPIQLFKKIFLFTTFFTKEHFGSNLLMK